MKLNKYIVYVCIIWTALITGLYLWNYSNLKKEQTATAFSTAKSFYNMILITRDWNARHGEVYVIVKDAYQPNPYLEHDKKNIVVDENLVLTMVNPAYMTREISEISEETDGIRFRMTSLKPIRPQNSPTPLETQILKEFENGLPDKGFFITEGNDKGKFFYMAPLKTTEACIKCHSNQGYKTGDIRGGISVTLPLTMKIPSTLLIGHLLIGAVGLMGIILSGGRLSGAYETIEKQAYYDTLTGIPNRKSFNEYMDSEFKRSRRTGTFLSVIMCDIDNFKAYNDTYGHLKGDETLRAVAVAIKDSLKRGGDFCARFGGEEFIIVLPDTDIGGAMLLAENIRKRVESMCIEHKTADHGNYVTVSLGASEVKPDDTELTAEKLISQADAAMYEAKKHGRNKAEPFTV
jgi:diguanylate cyclase (GGDEF)-like protein